MKKSGRAGVHVGMFAFLLCAALVSCKPKTLPEPKPMGYFRIDLPEHQYNLVDTAAPPPGYADSEIYLLPFRYEQSIYAHTSIERQKDHSIWMNVVYPGLGASLRFTCFTVENADSLRRDRKSTRLNSSH